MSYGFPIDLDDRRVPSYSNEDRARQALQEAFGSPGECKLCFNVILARNSAGRVVPILCNMSKDDFHFLIHSKFLKVS